MVAAPPGGRREGGSGTQAETRAEAKAIPAATRKKPRKPKARTTISPSAGPIAVEVSPEIPKIPRAWPRRSGGARATTRVKFATKYTE